MNELNFTSESLKLLDSFIIPSKIIHNNRILHANRVSDNTAEIDINSIFDKSCVSWEAESINYIRIKQRNLRIDIKRSSICEHMVMKICYNRVPCYLVLSNYDFAVLSFNDCIDHINKRNGIEKILVVDDDPVLVQTYELIFEILGYQAFIFSNPAQVLNVMESLDFDLLISDYNMPDMNGLELVRKLIEVKPDIPVIICSGAVGIYNELSKSSGCEHPVTLLNKPVTIKKISDSIEVMEFVAKICSFCREFKNGR